MADRIVGYPPTITVSGDVITFAAGEFDTAIFDTFTTSDYVIKTNGTAATSLITAIGGLQGDGTYDITVTSGHGFVTGDRCSPQVGNTTLTYTTIASAFTASASTGADTLRLWFSDTSDAEIWEENISNSATTKGVSVVGMLPSGRVTLFPGNSSHLYNLSGALGGITTQLNWTNFSIIGDRSSGINQYGLVYNDTGATGAGVIISRCRTSGFKIPLWVQKSAAAAIVVKNCIILYAGQDGIQSLTTAKEIYNNTIAFCVSRGYNSNAADTVKNNLSFKNRVADFTFTSSTLSYNWSSDATSTGTGAGTNKTFADIDFIKDNANNFYPNDYRVTPTAGILAQGNTATGVTIDIDGQTRPGTPAIGASEGITLGATPDFPARTNVTTDDTVDGLAGLYVPLLAVDGRLGSQWGANGTEFTGTLVPAGSVPGNPTLDSAVAGNGQVVLTFTAADAADVIYARYRTSHDGAWAAESELLKRTGSGTIVVTGLPNETAHEFSGYAKDGTTTSQWVAPRIAVPTDGSAAAFVSILNAVAAEINARSLTDLAGNAITATVDYLPNIDPENDGPLLTPKIFVMPGDDAPEPDGKNLDLVRYPVTAVLVQRVVGDATYSQTQKIERMMWVKRQVQEALLNKRLPTYTLAYAETITPTAAYDYEALKDMQQYRTGIQATFITSEAT